MILLLGGTRETAPAAEALAKAGYRVLVSTATDVPLFVGSAPDIAHRRGRLDEAGMGALVRTWAARAIVDVTHPYASEVRAIAARVAAHFAIPYLSYLRPRAVEEAADIRVAASHEEAACLACESGKPILLTIGSTYIRPYAAEAQRRNIPLVARVLGDSAAVAACSDAGIPEERIVAGRGPFGAEETRGLLRRFGIGVLVTKDSGEAGGVREKVAAARSEGCAVVVVDRPGPAQPGACASLEELVRRVRETIPHEEARAPRLLALDLESVLVPEIWPTVAQAVGLPALMLTTRDVADYEALMRRRLELCRQHGLTLSRLREVVGSMEPLPGAAGFLAWAQQRALVVIVSDTYHELAGPAVTKLGGPFMICNWLTVDTAGYIGDFHLRAGGKAGTVRQFQRLGLRVIAVGDSFNDLPMLQAADAGVLFRPCPGMAHFETTWSFAELIARLTGLL